MPSVNESLTTFLKARATRANADLVARYHLGMEVQTNVIRGEPVEGKNNVFTDGQFTWASFRIPHDAAGDAHWEDRPISWPLDLYAEAIGLTGWDWQKKVSRWVGLDIDSIFNHAEGVGVTEEEMERVKEAAQALPYVEVRRSTSGNGLHLYVHLAEIPTENHTEHAALARSILGRMSADCGFDFSTSIDCCGSVLWVWHKRMTAQSFEVLKRPTALLTESDLPNWRDHIDVVNRKRSKVRINGVDDSIEALSSSRKITPLDAKHREMIEELQRSGYTTLWIADHHLLQTHTKALEEVPHIGIFQTNSEGKDKGTPNCFMFPIPGGAWRVYRFSPGIQEADTWEQDGEGWTNCYYNRQADLSTVAKVVGAIRTSRGCTCRTVEQAAELAKHFDFELPGLQTKQPIVFRQLDPHMIVAETAKTDGVIAEGWGLGYRKYEVAFPVESLDDDLANYDATARHLVTTEKADAGWMTKTPQGWTFEPKSTALDVAQKKHGFGNNERNRVAGEIAANPWMIVNEPFGPEFLPGRQLNRFGAQLSTAPTHGEHPHYDRILRHIGAGLDEAVKADPWCVEHGIATGFDYLKLWCALLFRRPKQHLPMLYLFSFARDNGKSALHRALGLLIKRGYVEGVRLLNEQFNKMMAGAVLVYLDEQKVTAENAQKVKAYVDEARVSIRLMRTDSFMFENFSHWIACYNFTDGVPVEDGDERVVMVEVPTLWDENKLDWGTQLRPALEAEKSNFLGTLFDLELPESGGRLYLPVLQTALKDRVMASNRGDSGWNPDELLERIIKRVKAEGRFSGQSRELNDWLGRGSWTNSPNHLRRYLRQLKEQLLQHGVTLDVSQSRTITLELAS